MIIEYETTRWWITNCRLPTTEAEERAGEHNSGTGEAEETFRLKARAPTFSVGDRVLKYNRRRDTRKGDKLEKRCQGPYIIVEVMGKGTYRLTTANGSPVKVLANSRDLKHFTGDAYASPSKATTVDLTSAPSEPPTSPHNHAREFQRLTCSKATDSLSSQHSSTTVVSTQSTLWLASTRGRQVNQLSKPLICQTCAWINVLQ